MTDSLQPVWIYSATHYHELWVLYVTVTFGTIAFAFTSSYQRAARRSKVVLSVAFVLFAIGNADSLIHVSELASGTAKLMETEKPVLIDLHDRMEGTATWKIVAMQLVGISAVLAALWAVNSPSPGDRDSRSSAAGRDRGE